MASQFLPFLGGAMGQGMEDTPQWSHPSRMKQPRANDRCRRCKQILGGRHCGSAECPWCASCARAVLPPSK